MSKHFKKPKLEQGKILSEPSSAKTGIQIDYPVFCFKYLHNNFDLTKCTDAQKIDFIERLHALSQHPWQKLQFMHKHSLGSEKIAKTSIRAGLPSIITSDINHLLAFRFSKVNPMVGHRNGNVFHIIYLDYNLSVYPH